MATHIDEPKGLGLLAREPCQCLKGRDGPVSRDTDRFFPRQRPQLHRRHCNRPKALSGYNANHMRSQHMVTVPDAGIHIVELLEDVIGVVVEVVAHD